MAYATQSALAGTSLAQRLGDLRAAFAERMARRRAYRQTLAELESLSDRDLLDLGLNRSEIHGVAREAAYGA